MMTMTRWVGSRSLPGGQLSLKEGDQFLGRLGNVIGKLDDLLSLEAEVGLGLVVRGRGPVLALFSQTDGAHRQLL